MYKKHDFRILKNITGAILGLCIAFMSIVVTVSLSLHIVYSKRCVKSFSMQPTINANITSADEDGDTVYINRFSDCKVGDIIVVKYSEEKTFIKRLIGLGGDEIKIKEEDDDYALYSSGNLVYKIAKTNTVDSNSAIAGTEAYYNQLYLVYLENLKNQGEEYIDAEGDACIKVPKGYCFVMGDNWSNSNDSMSFGPLKATLINGRVDIIVHKGDNKFTSFLKGLFGILF